MFLFEGKIWNHREVFLTFPFRYESKGNDVWYICLQTYIPQSCRLMDDNIPLAHVLLSKDIGSCTHLRESAKTHPLSSFHTEYMGHIQTNVAFIRSPTNCVHKHIQNGQMTVYGKIRGMDTKLFWSGTYKNHDPSPYLQGYLLLALVSNEQTNKILHINNIHLKQMSGKTWFCIFRDDRTLLHDYERYHNALSKDIQ